MPVYSLTYSIPYFAFLLFLLVMMFLEFRNISKEKDNRLVELIVQAGLLLFFGLRGFVLTDWMVYYPLFDGMPTIWDGLDAFSTDFSELYSTDETIGRKGVELGFIYYTLFFKSLIPDYYVWVFFNSLVDFVILHFFFKRYSPYYVLSFIFFFIFDGCGIEINLMRNIKSILLFLISLKYLEERKPLPYFLLNGLGFLFHSSSIIYFAVYFFLHKKWSKKVIWPLFAIGVLLLLFQVQFIGPALTKIGELVGGRIGLIIQFYLVSDLYGGSYGLFHFGYLERVFTFVLMFSLYDRLIEKDQKNVLFLNSFVLYFFIYFYLSEISVIVERTPLLFVFCYWILYPQVFNLIPKKINKLLFLCVFLLFSSAKTLKTYSNVFAKYDNLLFGSESYELRHERFINHSSEIIDK